MKSGTVPTSERATDGQLLDLASALVQATPRLIARERADELLKSKGSWQEAVRGVLLGTGDTGEPNRQLERWERHLFERYSCRVDCGKLIVPELPPGKLQRPRLGVNTDRLKLNQRFDVCARLFPSWRYSDDLDGVHEKSQPRPRGDYAFWYEGAVEPPEDCSNFSPDQLDERKLIYLTIGERLIIEPFYFEESGGGHLDLVNWTITSSRYSFGRAFCAGWGGEQFGVDDWGRGFAGADGRARQAVVNL